MEFCLSSLHNSFKSSLFLFVNLWVNNEQLNLICDELLKYNIEENQYGSQIKDMSFYMSSWDKYY